ncbi:MULTISPECIES: restriction endonuclease subunit S [Comamonas]|uniref:restriction endonuclease subunit S n=1 Tax=Comamonas TaxID=283 RepID=UPI0001DA69CC|nr:MULTISPECIES: restriction endonuclease subunit S [Comamonas]EFI61445.1 type I restriction-modification system, S subunit [Comamonas thiooxydans]TFF62131.1 restriction endonuclease subunit S [Comamonas sp. A23]
MSFPRYPAYKDSGVEWLGEVPAHWIVAPLKRGFSVTLGKMLQSDSSGPEDELLPYLRAANIQWTGIDASDIKQMWLSPRDRVQLALQLGDLLVSEGGDVGRSCLWADEIANCSFQNSVNRVRATHGGSTRFLYYWMSTIKDKGYVDVLCNKSTIAHFTAEKVAAVPVPFPLPPEQTAIVRFLDHETAKIDALVAEQEKLIALLQEKRQAVISHAVTKGLNPNAPMKDSGVEWLREVPVHWEVTALKRHWTATDCKHVTAEFVEDGIPLASIREVQSRWVELGEAKRTTEHFYQLLIEGGRDPRPGDLIFSRNATVGEVAQVHQDHQPFAMGQDVVLLRRITEATSPDFLQLAIRSSVVMLQLSLCMVGSTFKRINVEEIRSLVLAFPPPDEQIKIANHLLAQAESFDSLMTEARTAIALLQERRTALISAAVTGQIDVRGWAQAGETSNFIAASVGAESV